MVVIYDILKQEIIKTMNYEIINTLRMGSHKKKILGQRCWVFKGQMCVYLTT